MKKMTREDELQIIESTKRLFGNKSAVQEMRDWYENALNDRDKLDLQTAAWDANGSMPEPNGKEKFHKGYGMEVPTLLTAGLMRSLLERCEHVTTDLSVVKYVFLSPRIVCCNPCIIEFADRFIEHDAKKLHADECDLCLKLGVSVFHKITTAFGGSIYFGDVCKQCYNLIMASTKK